MTALLSSFPRTLARRHQSSCVTHLKALVSCALSKQLMTVHSVPSLEFRFTRSQGSGKRGYRQPRLRCCTQENPSCPSKQYHMPSSSSFTMIYIIYENVIIYMKMSWNPWKCNRNHHLKFIIIYSTKFIEYFMPGTGNIRVWGKK